jgi:ATP-dependent DNA ligase
VIGGYIPTSDLLDSLLVGYYEGRELMYAASVRAGIPPEFRRVLIPHLEALRISRCPSSICRIAVKADRARVSRLRRWQRVAGSIHSSSPE